MDPAAGLVAHLVGRVLDQLEELPVAVSALGDTALAVGVLGDQARVDAVRVQDTTGLLDDGADDRRLRIGHERFHFKLQGWAARGGG